MQGMLTAAGTVALDVAPANAANVATIDTRSARLAFTDRPGRRRPIVFLHGNSFSSRIFAPQLLSPSLLTHRLVLIDLPGHGQSEDAKNPTDDYTITGLAATIGEALTRLHVPPAILVGWSLGGQIALEVAARHRPEDKLFLLGASPLANPIDLADFPYRYPASFERLGPEPWSVQDIEIFVKGCLASGRAVDFMIQDAVRTDYRVRQRTSESAVTGMTSDQVSFVQQHQRPIAVVAGDQDAFIRFDYLDRVPWRNRWRGRTLLLPGAGHAASWESPSTLEALIAEFSAS